MSKLRKLSIVSSLLIGMIMLAGCVPAASTGTTDQTGGVSSYFPIIIFVVLMIAMMYFLTIRPQQKKQKEAQKLIENLKKGDAVITIGGMYGKIERIGKDSIVLEVESGATIRVTKSSIAGKIQLQ
jgi:preprotein translocase subunit YajC